jgi:hypothetical protein
MKSKFITIIACILLASFATATDVSANTAGSSARLAYLSKAQSTEYKRTLILRNFLMEYDSPLAPHAHTFIAEAEKNNIDWKLVAAICGVESYFGHQIPSYSYNGWGYGVYGNNVRRFSSWDEGIATVSAAIRTDYIDSWGAGNVQEIGAIYAADPAWANKVTHFLNLIESYEKNSSSKAISISI